MNTPGFGIVTNNVFKAANHNYINVNALNIVHADTGLTGVHIIADGNNISSYVKAAVDSLHKLPSEINDEKIAVAKKLAQVEETLKTETSSILAQYTAEQLLANRSALSPVEYSQEIDRVTAEDIKKVS